jgi:hypothetical protein
MVATPLFWLQSNDAHAVVIFYVSSVLPLLTASLLYQTR